MIRTIITTDEIDQCVVDLTDRKVIGVFPLVEDAETYIELVCEYLDEGPDGHDYGVYHRDQLCEL